MHGRPHHGQRELDQRATKATRGKTLAIYMITIYFAVAVGQLLLNAGDPGGFELFVLAGVLLTLGILPVTLTGATAPVTEERSRLKIRELWAVSPLGLTGVAGARLVNSFFYGMGPIFAQRVGLDVAGISAFKGVTVFAGLLMQWPVGRISDRYDRRTVLTGVFFGVALASLAIVVAAGLSSLALFALVALYGGLSFTVCSISISHANDFIAPGDLVKASGSYVLIYGTGAVIGPAAAAALMAWIGPSGLFVYAAVINLLLGAFALYRMTRREARPKAEQGAFVALPATSVVVKALDPRVDSEISPNAEARKK
jgi:predicted MFS family arabinose efflux permease